MQITRFLIVYSTRINLQNRTKYYFKYHTKYHSKNFA